MPENYSTPSRTAFVTGPFVPTTSTSPCWKRVPVRWFYACTVFLTIHAVGFPRSSGSQDGNIGPSRLRCAAFGREEPHRTYLHGAADGCMSPDPSDGMEAAFNNGLRRVVMPGVGHSLHLEQSEEVAEQILEFLKS